MKLARYLTVNECSGANLLGEGDGEKKRKKKADKVKDEGQAMARKKDNERLLSRQMTQKLAPL